RAATGSLATDRAATGSLVTDRAATVREAPGRARVTGIAIRAVRTGRATTLRARRTGAGRGSDRTTIAAPIGLTTVARRATTARALQGAGSLVAGAPAAVTTGRTARGSRTRAGGSRSVRPVSRPSATSSARSADPRTTSAPTSASART